MGTRISKLVSQAKQKVQEQADKVKKQVCCQNLMPKLPELPKMPEMPLMIDITLLDKLQELGIPIPKNLLPHPLIKIDLPVLPTFKGFPECYCPKDCECRKKMNPKYDASNESTYSDKSTS